MEFKYTNGLNKKAVFSLQLSNYYSSADNSELYHPTLTTPLEIDSTDSVELNYYLGAIPALNTPRELEENTEYRLVTILLVYAAEHSSGYIYAIAEIIDNGAKRYCPISKRIVRIEEEGVIKYANCLGIVASSSWQDRYIGLFTSIAEVKQSLALLTRSQINGYLLEGDASSIYSLTHTTVYESDGLIGLSVPSETYNKWYRFNQLGIEDIGGKTPSSNLPGWGSAFITEQRKHWLYPVRLYKSSNQTIGSVSVRDLNTSDTMIDYHYIEGNIESIELTLNQFKQFGCDTVIGPHQDFFESVDLVSHEDGGEGNTPSWLGEKHYIINEELGGSAKDLTLMVSDYISRESFDTLYLYDLFSYVDGTLTTPFKTISLIPYSGEETILQRNIIISKVIVLPLIVKRNGVSTVVTNNVLITAVGIVDLSSGTISPLDSQEEEDYKNQDWEVKLVDTDGNDYTPTKTYNLQDWTTDIEIIAGNKSFPISRLFLSLDLVSDLQEFDAMVELCYGTPVSDTYAGLLYYNRDSHVSTNLYKKERDLQSPLYLVLNSYDIMAAKFTADNGYEFNMGIISDLLKVGNNYWNILSNPYEDHGFTNDRRSLLCINNPGGAAQSFSILTVKNERKIVRTLGEDNRRKNTIVITVIENNLPIPTVQNAEYSLEYTSEEESIEEGVPYTTVLSTIRTDTLSPISYLNTLLTGQILFNSVIPGTLSYELNVNLDKWFHILSITDESDIQTINFVIEFLPNNIKARLLDITFKYTSDGVVYDLYKISIPLSLNPERYNPKYDDIKKYWSSGKIFTLIDSNEGTDYSSTSLLYKNNHTNIYETLTQKDNTLFLGNYKSTEQEIALYKRLEEVELQVLFDLLITVSEELLDYQLSSQDEDWYGYTPDLTLNSAEKRIFKKGETYNIGISFLHKTGYWSSVFIPKILLTWQPSEEPSIVQKNDNLWYLRKPVLKVNLNKEAVDAMTSLGFIGAIPVRVEKQNHSILALGITQKALTSEHRKENDYIDYMYPWSSKLTGLNSEKEASSIIPWYGEYSPVTWGKAKKVFVLNSPEVESNDYLLLYTLEDSYVRKVSTQLIKCIKASGNIFTYGSLYLHSKVVLENLKREPYADNTANTLYLYGGPFFHGFLDLRYGREGGDYTAADLNRQEAYSDIMLFYWNRERLSGENSTLKKRLINYLVLEEVENNIRIDAPTQLAKIFRDFDSVLSKTLKVDGKNKIYQANTDLIITYDADHPYANISYKGWHPWVYKRGSIDYVHGRTGDFWGKLYHEDSHINEDTSIRPWGVGSKPINGDGGGPIYGIGENGHVNDPINIRYKSAPHIFFSAEIDSHAFGDSRLALCEIYKDESTDFTDVNYLQNQMWIKCGEMRRLKGEKNLNLLYEEGDYFYGRFDSLRVEPFALGNAGDTNQNAEVVSFLCSSRINLDARTDSFRGVVLPIMNHTNFNRFNHVYDLSNNYFTFAYIDYKDSASADPLKVSIYERLFRSSILWSMTKLYGEEIDSWLNIQDVNTLDLDGDKGSLTALVKLNNNILAFLETGIALVLYNEKTLVSVTEGVPVEIANSGKVDGKAYFSSNIGCQNKFSIAEGLRGLYFIDAINKTIYLFDGNKGLIDICATYLMKSWGLNNLSKDWWAYYDKRSQEVLFMSKNDCIVFSDKDAIFNCFLSYVDVRWHFYMNDYVYAWKLPTKATSVTRFWKKNSLNKTSFFGNPQSLYLQLIANPEPLLDKTFTNIEYRADVFSKNAYLPELTFTTVLVEDEFLNTGEIALDSVNNRKKFRVWRIDIPRDALTPHDRIRNPWCKIKLGYTWPTDTNADKLLFYDAVVSYLL